MRILVVDDDSLAAEMTAMVLEAVGHEPEIAENGIEAMEKLAADNGFEVIVSDQNMPLLTGIELFRDLRRQGVTLPFILLTGDDPAGPRTLEPALDACLMKDFTLEESLPNTLAAVCARHGLRF
ncbi:Response regulator [uncultured Gammaproteobacteria bacterium]